MRRRCDSVIGQSALFEALENRTLRSASAGPVLTDPGHNLHVSVGQTINIDPTPPLDIDYVTPTSVTWDLNYDGEHFDSDVRGAQPRVAFDHAGTFVVAGRYDYGGGLAELRTFAVMVSDDATESADPKIHINAPTTATVGQTIKLVLTTDHAGETVQYMLDDAGFSGPNGPVELERAFGIAGTHELKVQLYVDGEYAGYAAHTITVAEPAAKPLAAVEVTPILFNYVAPPTIDWSHETSDEDDDLLA